MHVPDRFQSVDGAVLQQIVALTTEKVSGCMKATDWLKIRNQWPHLRGIQFPRLRSRYNVDMPIGVDYADLHFAKGVAYRSSYTTWMDLCR